MSEQQVTLKETKQCKHSVRFDNPDKNSKVLSSVYVLRPAYEAMHNPKEITVTINGPRAKE